MLQATEPSSHAEASPAGELVTLKALQDRTADNAGRSARGPKRVRSNGHVRTASQPPPTLDRARPSAEPDEPFEIEL